MTKDENSILGQIAADVRDVSITLARVETKVSTLGDVSLDHEGRIRGVEQRPSIDPKEHDDLMARVVELEKTTLSRKGFVPLATVALLALGIVYNLLHGAGKV